VMMGMVCVHDIRDLLRLALHCRCPHAAFNAQPLLVGGNPTKLPRRPNMLRLVMMLIVWLIVVTALWLLMIVTRCMLWVGGCSSRVCSRWQHPTTVWMRSASSRLTQKCASYSRCAAAEEAL
jgi:hypothetical protein